MRARTSLRAPVDFHTISHESPPDGEASRRSHCYLYLQFVFSELRLVLGASDLAVLNIFIDVHTTTEKMIL